jgi:hypothetical protein
MQGANKKLRAQLREELLNLEQLEESDLLTLNQMHRKVQLNEKLYKMMEEEELY